ncbi:MAG: Epimerase family protein [Bacteroidota bacterium]|nr:MAG: Epimerase family protein [Bacteroidota bacterium]
MRILISGASGLVGKALIPILEQSGHQVSVLSTRSNTTAFASHITSFHWNPEKGILDRNALNDVDVIISLAGAKIAQRWTSKSKKSILDSRVLGTRLVVDALKSNQKHRVAHFISASAIGIYPSSFTTRYTESNTDVAKSFPAEVVRAWEAEVDKANDIVAHVSKIRIGLVLAQGGGALLPLAIPTSLGFGAWFGNGKQWQSWIHIQDLVRLFAFSLENPGIYNGVAPNPVSQKALVKSIAKTYRVPQWLPGVPKGVIKTVMGDMGEVLFDSINASSATVENQGFVFKYPLLKDALKDLLPLRRKK